MTVHRGPAAQMIPTRATKGRPPQCVSSGPPRVSHHDVSFQPPIAFQGFSLRPHSSGHQQSPWGQHESATRKHLPFFAMPAFSYGPSKISHQRYLAIWATKGQPHRQQTNESQLLRSRGAMCVITYKTYMGHQRSATGPACLIGKPSSTQGALSSEPLE